MPTPKPTPNATSGAPGTTSSVTITASMAAGCISLSVNGAAGVFSLSDHTGLSLWIQRNIYSRANTQTTQGTRSDTLDNVARKLEEGRRK